MSIVFVIGAGASAEVGLPIGSGLTTQISQLLSFRLTNSRWSQGDSIIRQAISQLVSGGQNSGDMLEYMEAAERISRSMPLAPSIDSFVHNHRGNEKLARCAKLAIVRSILIAESGSQLIRKSRSYRNIDFNSIKDTWYVPFFQLLVGNRIKSNLEERLRHFKLIIFNYDRCVEHFIHCALQTYYGLSGKEAGELVNSLEIHHPYGSVGTLPYNYQTTETVEYGGNPDERKLLELSDEIYTFTEGMDHASSGVSKIKEHMKDASKVVFLGFGFHELNMTLIKPQEGSDSWVNTMCFATTLGMSESDRNICNQQIRKLYGGRTSKIRLVDSKCSEFFYDYSRTLAF